MTTRKSRIKTMILGFRARKGAIRLSESEFKGVVSECAERLRDIVMVHFRERLEYGIERQLRSCYFDEDMSVRFCYQVDMKGSDLIQMVSRIRRTKGRKNDNSKTG